MIKSKKAVNEIISTILIMLVMVIVVGIIITGVSSQISKGKEKLNYDNSIKVRDLVFSEIMEIYNSPIESTKEINFSLSNLELTIDSDTETIEICSVGKNLSFFADGKRLEQDNNKYVYRELQKVCAGVVFENIDLIRSITLSNKEQTRLVFKKITDAKISVSVDNETTSEWYTQKNEYVYDENAGEWLYRKKIMITGNNILGNLNNIPITITLTDEDLKNYAKEDGSDLLFTLADGVTKLKKEILSYDSGTGELTVLLTIPSFDVGPDVNVYTYDEKTRKKITIDHTKVDSDLNDFPVLISIKDENLVNLANSDGNDIYFTASDGTTKLKREIESFTDINLFRKKITIDHTKVDADLNDFPVLISIKDQNLIALAKEDGSDIYFTSTAGNRLKREIESFTKTISYRKKITIDHTKVDANLTNFPILISITDSDLASHGANTDGNDIYFTTNDGTKLKREIEDYNSTTGVLVAWVKIPNLPSTIDTNIYINFGDTAESNTNDKDVWDENFKTIMHFKENTKTNDINAFFDSTINNMNGILKSFNFDENSNTGVSGKIGSSVLLDGLDDYMVISQPTIGDNITYSQWINKKSTNSRRATRNGGGAGTSGYIIIYDYKNFGLYLGGGTPSPGYLMTTSNDLKTNDWSLVTWTYDKNALKLFIDGNLKNTFAVSRTTGIDNSYLGLGLNYGCGPPTCYEKFFGRFDELRISTTLRSDSWIKTEYNNQSSPSTFSSLGNLETLYGSLVAWVKIPTLSSTIDTNIYMYFGNSEESNTNDTDVWDSNYVGVWHLNDYNTTNIKESKTGLASATKTAINQPFQTPGKIGRAQDFDGVNDSINTLLGPFAYPKSTVSFWSNFDNIAGVPGNSSIMVGSAYWGNNNFSITQHGNNYYMMFTVATGNYAMFHNSFSETNKWYYYSFSYDSDQNTWNNALKAYIDGTAKSISSSAGDRNQLEVSGSYKLKISTSAYFAGLIDEVRISNINRSSSWIKTEYNNQASPETFSTVGNLEDVTINLVAWVKVPNLSSTTDTDIYMYFGDPAESNTNDTDVWDVNAALVMHFNNNALDSTSYTNNGTVSGSPEYASGIGSKAMYFDGNNDSISLGNKTIASPLQMREGIVTVEHWINLSNTYNYSSSFFFLGSAGGGWRGCGTGFSYPSQLYTTEVYGSTGGRQNKYLSSGNIYNIWKHLVVIFDGINNRITFFVDGNQVSQQSFSDPGDVNSTTSPFIIGSHSWTSFYKGLMDELKVYNKELSPSWIKTEYNNQSTPSTFYSVGEMADANVVILTTPTAANANTGVYLYFGNSDANISDYDIGDGNTVNISVGVLEKS